MKLTRLKNMYSKLLIFVATLVISLSCIASISFDNSDWNLVLNQYVNERGFVDYQALAKNRDAFDRYLSQINSRGPSTNPEQFPTHNDKLAYYINAYNALVFEGVLKRGPEQKSVWSGLISGRKFFVSMKVQLDGMQTNLKKLEDDIIRDEFKDPRIHAAINCASISCPRLPQQPFEADQLDQQLDTAMGEFVNQASNVDVDTDANIIYLSKIFDWFEADFIEFEKAQQNPNPSLISYINRYRSEENRILPGNYKIKFFKYDKGINQQG